MNSNAATLRVAAFPRANLLTDVLLVLAGTGLIAASAQISVKLPFTPVPITGQTFAVVLVGASLGSLCGTASAMLYLWLGVAGAPVYAHHASGWDVITSASGGYIVASSSPRRRAASSPSAAGTAGSPPRSARC
jgi:biotin transport system substrate-specific component